MRAADGLALLCLVTACAHGPVAVDPPTPCDMRDSGFCAVLQRPEMADAGKVVLRAAVHSECPLSSVVVFIDSKRRALAPRSGVHCLVVDAAWLDHGKSWGVEAADECGGFKARAFTQSHGTLSESAAPIAAAGVPAGCLDWPSDGEPPR